MTAWTPDLSGLPGPKYQAVADALSAAIGRGELWPGSRLPPQRELASRLGFDLTTITRAYEIARKRGHVVTRGRAGSFVSQAAGASGAVTPADTAMNAPPVPQGGILQAALTSGMRAVLAAGDVAAFQYQNPGGSPAVRQAGCRLLESVGLHSEAGQVVTTAGGQNGLHAIMNVIARPGDRIACGRFVYPGFRAVAERAGVELVPLPELTGVALERACAAGPVRALYVVPTNDNPTTATVPPAERQRIAEVARHEGVQLIEDDAYGLLDPQPLAPISAHAPELSWYVLSTSKIISPALRVAFVRAPGIGQALQLVADLHQTAVMAPPINAAIVSQWLGDGTFERLVTATRSEAVWRIRLARETLGGNRFDCHECGYHLWVKMPAGVSADDLSRRLAASGIGTIPSSRFVIKAAGEAGGEQALRLSLGSVADEQSVAAALRMLAGGLAAPSRQWDGLI